MRDVLQSVLGLLLGTICLAVPLRAQSNPYTVEQIERHVRQKLPDGRILSEARRRCPDFTLGANGAERLQRAGASAQLVRDLRNACPRAESARVDSARTTARTQTARTQTARTVARPPSVDELIRRADGMREWADYAGALREYRRVIAMDRSNARAHDGAGQALLFLDNRELDALAAFERAVELRPNVSDYHAHLASAFSRLRRYREAETHANQAVRLNQGSAAAHYQLGRALEGLGRLQEARQAMAAAVRLAPRTPAYYGTIYASSLDWLERQLNVSTRSYDISGIAGIVESVQFFEGTVNGPRVYRYRFQRDSLRRVAWNVTVRHPAPSRSTDIELVALFYRADGSEWFRDTLVSNVSTYATREPTRLSRSRGFDTPGRWQAGTYRVDFLHFGERVASSAFEVVDTATADIPAINGRVTSLRFFEAGAAVRPSEAERSYRYRFAATTTRYVHSVVDIESPPVQGRAELPLQLIYYAPDGLVLGQTAATGINANATSGARWIFHVSLGIGNAEPGKWIAGRYRVDVMSGTRRIARGWFDVY